jgi:hypothetical protein
MARKDDKDRVGDVLGLGDIETPSAIEREPGMRHESDAARRRERMREGADELTPSATTPERGSGATGIDMGSGGDGTDIE